jgi:hypothetical protein
MTTFWGLRHQQSDGAKLALGRNQELKRGLCIQLDVGPTVSCRVQVPCKVWASDGRFLIGAFCPTRSKSMDTTTLLIIIVVLLLLGGGWFGRGRWY